MLLFSLMKQNTVYEFPWSSWAGEINAAYVQHKLQKIYVISVYNSKHVHGIHQKEMLVSCHL